jgi:hypothetical protein
MTKQELDSLQPGDIIVEDDGEDGEDCCIIQVIAVTEDSVSYVILDTTVSDCWPPGFEATFKKQSFSYSSVYLEKLEKLERRCECGAERCGFNSHSYWCPRR